ncbi:MAG: hypothetical protein LBF78_01140 [Treponema sp.]|jgi:hypothetical protein|nr:hypothetical protein [Treponema sp.]
MENEKKKRILVLEGLLILGLVLAGCELDEDAGNSAYMFKFRVQNNNSTATIVRVEFLNGTNRNSFVLRQTYGTNLGQGELSNEYKVSGFTEKYGTDERYCAVIITYNDGTDAFGYWHSGHEGKILVRSIDDYWTGDKKIEFSQGKW